MIKREQQEQPISITRLSSGYWHIRGRGPCNWTQPQTWPAGDDEIRSAAFPQASPDFLSRVMRLARQAQ